MFAAQQGKKALVKELIASGADVKHTSPTCETALMLAGQGHHVSTFKTLIEARTSANSRGHGEESPLVSAARCDYFAGVQVLVKQEGSVDPNDSEVRFPLIPGTLDTMEMLCLATNEFRPMSGHVMKRLQLVCKQMQAAPVDQAMLISFATILFRLCRLLLKCHLASPVLRFTSSRTTSASFQAFHEKIDHTMELMEFDSSDPAHLDWETCWEDDCVAGWPTSQCGTPCGQLSEC